MKPFFARVGGKTKLSKFIVSLMPKDYTEMTYVEPFVGAGAVLFRKEPSKEEIINDLDKDIANIYKDIKKVDEVSSFNLIPNRKLFNYYKENDFTEPKRRLKRNLYISYNSFASNRRSFGIRHKSLRNTGATLTKYFNEYKKRLSNVKIYNKDFAEIVKKYDSANTLFYLDPPYEDCDDYGEILNPEKVYNVVKNIKGKFILSYNNSKTIRQLFKDYKIRKVRVVYTQNKNHQKEVNELIITNY